ncbi:hypothetical protein CHU98_g9328 [Xylaria longipes]|nr:hypothetical protein CHU98_g9328 [Xylaria longipes]
MESVMAPSPTKGQASATPSARSQTRSACNRCHQQKLRCIKTKEQASCERCARLKTECRYRPRGRRNVRNGLSDPGSGSCVEPRSLAPAIVPAMPNMTGAPEEIDYDWFSFLNTDMNNAEEFGYLDSDLRLPLPTGLGRTFGTVACPSSGFAEPLSVRALEHHDGEVLDIVPFHQDTIGAVGSNHSPDSHSPYGLHGYHDKPSRGLGRPLSSTVGRLTSLSMALYECASKLPSIKITRDETAGTANVPYAMGSSRREGALLALDEIFRATNEFIDVMKSPYPTTSCPEILTTASMSTTSHLTQGVPTALPPRVTPQVPVDQPAIFEGFHEAEISSSIPPFPHLDEATLLLCLSCHCQLVEIYKSVFHAMRRCLEGSNAAPPSRTGIILPQLQVGGSGGVSCPALRVDFNEPLLPPATVSMYMTLITMLSSQLWAQVADALRSGRGRDYDNSSNQAPILHLGVAGPTWGVAMERTDNMERTIELVKRML